MAWFQRCFSVVLNDVGAWYVEIGPEKAGAGSCCVNEAVTSWADRRSLWNRQHTALLSFQEMKVPGDEGGLRPRSQQSLGDDCRRNSTL